MKRLVILIVGILLVGLLVAGCVQRPTTTTVTDQGVAADDDASDISEDVEGVGDLDEELDLGELDTLEDDLDNLI